MNSLDGILQVRMNPMSAIPPVKKKQASITHLAGESNGAMWRDEELVLAHK